VSEMSATHYAISNTGAETDPDGVMLLPPSAPDGGQPTGSVTGPLGTACQEIRVLGDRVDVKTLRRSYLVYLLNRTDRMLDGLEQLNLLDMEDCPDIWRSHLAALAADLPFDYRPVLSANLAPTGAIDIVFDIQERLLAWMTGRAPESDELLEAGA
jgi:hypothetical protein